jgi:hypothetical protein
MSAVVDISKQKAKDGAVVVITKSKQTHNFVPVVITNTE